jgi:hypothetical protein
MEVPLVALPAHVQVANLVALCVISTPGGLFSILICYVKFIL